MLKRLRVEVTTRTVPWTQFCASYPYHVIHLTNLLCALRYVDCLLPLHSLSSATFIFNMHSLIERFSALLLETTLLDSLKPVRNIVQMVLTVGLAPRTLFL